MATVGGRCFAAFVACCEMLETKDRHPGRQGCDDDDQSGYFAAGLASDLNDRHLLRVDSFRASF